MQTIFDVSRRSRDLIEHIPASDTVRLSFMSEYNSLRLTFTPDAFRDWLENTITRANKMGLIQHTKCQCEDEKPTVTPKKKQSLDTSIGASCPLPKKNNNGEIIDTNGPCRS